MKTTIQLFSLVLFLALAACSTPQMAVDQNLSNKNTAYAVSGRQGWLINQQLAFGPYQTGRVQRGWTRSYDIPFIVRFAGASEKLHFTVSEGDMSAEVFALGKLRRQELPVFNDLFRVELKDEEAFTGTVVLDGIGHFDFYVTSKAQGKVRPVINGGVAGDIEIRPVQRLDNGKTALMEQPLGYEFVRDGRAVAAVETINNGRVWMDESLPADQRLVYASLAAALLLRSELAEAVQ